MSEYALEVRKQLLDLGLPDKDKAKRLVRVKRAIIVENALAHLRRLPGRKYWRTKQASGRIERFLRLKTEPKPAEIADIAAAHARHAPKLMVANSAENRELADELRKFISTALVADAEFYGPEIEAAREVVRALSDLVRSEGDGSRAGP